MEFTEEDVCKLFDDEETNNTSATIPSNNDDITILFSVNDKTTNNSSLAKIQCLPNGFNVNGKRSPSNTTHNVFVSDQLRVQLFKPLDIDGSLVCQLFINETLHTEKTFNELHECSLTIPRCNKGGSNGKSRIGYLKLVQKQDEQKLVGLSNNFWIRTKTRKETVTNDKKTTEDKKLKKREYEEDSESSYSSDSKRKKQPTSDTINNEQTHSLFEENQGLKKRIAELEKLVSDILTGKLDQIPMTAQNPAIGQSTLKNTKPRPSPLSVPTLLTSNTFGMCSPTNLMTSSCSSPGLEMSPTFFMTSPPRTGFEDYPSNYSFDDMSDFF